MGVAVFTDMLLYGLIVPILPYMLSGRVGIPQEDVQKWNSILLGSFGGALTIGSRKGPLSIPSLSNMAHRLMPAVWYARVCDLASRLSDVW